MRHRLLLLAAGLAAVACQSGLEPTNPDAPTDLVYQLIPSGDPLHPMGIILEWTPPASGQALSYDVYGASSLEEEFVLRATTTSPSFHDVGDPQLQYFVQAVDGQGRVMGSSDTVTVDAANTLPAPQGLASVTLNGGVELSWDPNAFNANPNLFDYYRVYSTDYDAVNGCSDAWALEGTTVSDGFVARNLPNGETRCFAVSAISLDGHESNWSNVIQDTPRFDARDVVVDVNTIVKHTVRLRALASRSTGIEVHMHLDDCNPKVRGDEQKLQQVLLNLLVNAESAMEDAEIRHLNVTTQKKQGAVQIVISDTGHGMSESVLQRVFEPFFTTKPAGKGTGLGLSVSYGIIQQHEGTITVDSTPEIGTTFTILLPLYAESNK